MLQSKYVIFKYGYVKKIKLTLNYIYLLYYNIGKMYTRYLTQSSYCRPLCSMLWLEDQTHRYPVLLQFREYRYLRGTVQDDATMVLLQDRRCAAAVKVVMHGRGKVRGRLHFNHFCRPWQPSVSRGGSTQGCFELTGTHPVPSPHTIRRRDDIPIHAPCVYIYKCEAIP